jgi:uncharacterized membrane protein HdeD (DUF308 family)
MSRAKADKALITPNVSPSWKWILGLGILFVILGCIGISMAIGLTIISMLFFAALLIVAGISHVLEVFKDREWKGMIWHAFIAILYIIGGCVVAYDPILASSFVTAMLAGILIILGATRIIMAIALRHSTGWGWLLFAGLAAIILGVLIMMQWPFSALWVIGMFIAFELLITGWTYIFIAFSLPR